MSKGFFNQTTTRMTLKEKFKYIKNHFYYDILNSWNGLKSLANNVKIYNLGLTNEQPSKFFDIICDNNTSQQLYGFLSDFIDDFDYNNNNCATYFNGRSDGYIVTIKRERNENIVDNDLLISNDYNDLIQNLQDWYGYTKKDARQEANNIIEINFKIVKNFDMFCDKLRKELIYILDNAEIKKGTYTKEIEYNYLNF